MTPQKNIAVFKKAVIQKKKIFDKALDFYNGDLFQWKEYPKKLESNELGKTKSAVYAFFVKKPKIHVKNILAAVGNLKERQKDNKLPKVNADNEESFKENGCLYIGSVTSEALEKRIKQHWRINEDDVGKSTFALKIKDWMSFAGMNEKDFNVYCCDMVSQETEIVRAVEDCLATMYHPLLGKRGDSPKG